MKKHTYALLLFCTISSYGLFAQSAPSVDWSAGVESTLYTGPTEDWIFDVFEASNGRYITGGYTESSGDYYPVMAAFSSGGNLSWETQVGDAQGVILDVTEISGGYVGVGSAADPNNSGEPSILFVQTNTSGTIIYQYWINQYTLTSLNSNYQVQGSTISPIYSGGNLLGYIICANYIDLTYGLRAGTVLINVGLNGTPDPTFGSSGIVEFEMHPGYPNTIPPFQEIPVYGRSYAVVTYNSSGNANGIVVAGSSASSSTDDHTVAFAATTDMYGSVAISPVYYTEASLVTDVSYTDNNTSTSPQCTPFSSGSFIDCGAYPFSNENDNTKVGGLIQSSYSSNYILGLQLDYYFTYGASCSFSNITIPSYINTDYALVELDRSDLSPIAANNIGRFTAIDYYTPIVDDGSGYSVLGGTIDDSGTDAYMYPHVFKTDYSLDNVWDQTYFGVGDYIDCSFGLGLTSDGGYIIGGNNDQNDEDYSLIKLGPNGYRQGGIQTAGSATHYSLQNGSAINQFDIHILTPADGQTVCRVYDISGQLVSEQTVASDQTVFSISLDQFSAGTYMVNVSDNNHCDSFKATVIK